MRAGARIAAWFLVACASSGTAGEGEPHEHAEGHADEVPEHSVTLWTEKHELFMEHRSLVVGSDVRFAVHVTLLPSFRAAREGLVTVSVLQADGSTVAANADSPRFPGIFGVTLRATRPGRCTMRVTIDDDVLAIPTCEVFPDARAAIAAAPEEGPEGISFLKEQQWVTEFATMPVTPRELQGGVSAHGEIRPVAGKEARLGAPAAGRLQLVDPAPLLGMAVTRGQTLATVLPRLSAGGDQASLDAEVLEARAEEEAATAQVGRAERLAAEGAIPERQLEEARARAGVAQARLAAASGRLQQYRAGASGTGGGGRSAFQIRSPIDGTLVEARATAGQTVEEGDLLFTVVDLQRVWLEADVFEPDLPRVEGATTAWFTVEGYEDAFTIDAATGHLVTVGRVIDPLTRTAPVVFDLENAGGRLRIGQFANVTIGTGPPVTALAIPDSALVEDGGRPVAYVQTEGESFQRRPLTLGIRSRGWVEVREGLRAGDHVVIRGAYEIKLSASTGSVPAHGHVH